MSNNWDNITVGMKVEVENTDCDNYSEGVPDSFWVATVLKIAGTFYSFFHFPVHRVSIKK